MVTGRTVQHMERVRSEYISRTVRLRHGDGVALDHNETKHRVVGSMSIITWYTLSWRDDAVRDMRQSEV